MVNFAHKAGGCLKLPDVNSSSTVVQRGQGWLGFAPGGWATKPKWWHRPSLCRFAGKSKRVAGAPLIFVNFRGLKPPHTMVNQGVLGWVL
ncbi:S2-RNase [Pyrus ussuriensis x Pyrus communis]|uniref:S2-RNase n=1 Tax=Pyrus ussuriensis x Pyrus communis TaxID=2448454 RepID=A0A5N5HCR6_9ROSA|nr:S2-RNase [Pyrus ussuriensis x Pyrus communis]